MFESDKFISRSGEQIVDYSNKITDNNWLKLDDGNYIILQDAENPNNQYDVEIAANEAVYQAQTHGARAEDTTDLTLTPVFSKRKNFTFTKPKDFTWKCSVLKDGQWVDGDETIAKVIMDEKGVGHIELTGNPGKVKFTLHVCNGSDTKAYDLATTAELTVLEGKTPFLKISDYSKNRVTLTGT